MAPGQHPAGHRPLPPPGRGHLFPELHRPRADRQRRPRPAAGGLVRHQVQPGAPGLAQGPQGDHRGAPGQDQSRTGRRRQSRSRQDHQGLPGRDGRHRPDQRLPVRPGGCGVQGVTEEDPRPARAEARVRDLRLLPPGGRGAPPVRRRRPRRAALVGSGRGLPDRDPRPGEGSDGQEHRHRAGRREGRVLRQAATRSVERPRGLAGRGGGVLPDLHLQPAGRHRQHHRGSRRSADRGDPLRRRRPLPGRGRRQRDRDLLRYRQRHLGRGGLLARGRLRLGWVGRLRPQGDGDHGPRRLAVGDPTLPGDGPGPPDRRLHLCRHRGHERRRVRQRDAAQQAHQIGGGLRPPAHLHRPRSRSERELGRATTPVRPAAFELGELRRESDLRRRGNLPANPEVHSGHLSRCTPPWASRRRCRPCPRRS